MALLFVQISLSVDGFIEDTDGGLEWFTEDRAVEAFATGTLRAIDGRVFGKAAHALLAEFWKNAGQQAASPDLATSAVLLSTCGGGRDDNLEDRLNLADPKLRFIHAIALAPNVSLNRNDSKRSDVTNVAHKFASQCLLIDQGQTTLSVKTESPVVLLASVTSRDGLHPRDGGCAARYRQLMRQTESATPIFPCSSELIERPATSL